MTYRRYYNTTVTKLLSTITEKLADNSKLFDKALRYFGPIVNLFGYRNWWAKWFAYDLGLWMTAMTVGYRDGTKRHYSFTRDASLDIPRGTYIPVGGRRKA